MDLLARDIESLRHHVITGSRSAGGRLCSLDHSTITSTTTSTGSSLTGLDFGFFGFFGSGGGAAMILGPLTSASAIATALFGSLFIDIFDNFAIRHETINSVLNHAQ